MVDFATLGESVLFEDPIDLLFFAPHEVPIVSIGLFPLSVIECPVDAVSK